MRYIDIKVVNKETGATYIHKNLTNEDLKWISQCPTLEVRVLKRR